MTYCVQCGTKVKAANRYCNACSAAIAIPDQHSHLLFPASLITPQTHIRPDKSETLPSESRQAYIFIYIVIIVTYFLLTLGLWIHRNHQARISAPITTISEKTQKPQSTLSTKALAAPIEKKQHFPRTQPPWNALKKVQKNLQNPVHPNSHIHLQVTNIFNRPSWWGFWKKWLQPCWWIRTGWYWKWPCKQRQQARRIIRQSSAKAAYQHYATRRAIAMQRCGKTDESVQLKPLVNMPDIAWKWWLNMERCFEKQSI